MKKILILFGLCLILSIGVSAQNSLPVYTLRFDFQGEPDLESIGANNKNSYWKIKYRLRIMSAEEFNQMSSVTIDENTPTDKTISQKFKWFKDGLFVTKGSLTKDNLIKSENRSVSLKLTLPEKAINLIRTNKEVVFILSVRSKFKSKLTRKKLVSEATLPILLKVDANFIFGSTTIISKDEDNSFSRGLYRFIEIDEGNKE